VQARQIGEEAMKSLIVAAALGLGSLGLIGATPAKANASWLSQALHARFDPYYYGGYYAPGYVYPSYNYYSPTYVYPGYGYNYRPGVSFWWGSGPRYSRGWHGHWHGHRNAWHGGHGHHHR
jgi:hypothetical protein